MGDHMSLDEIRLTFEQIKKWGATHLVIVCDTFSYEDYPIIVEKGKNIDMIVADHDGPNMQRVHAVYSTELDFDAQVKVPDARFLHPTEMQREYLKLEVRTDPERLALIRKWSDWFYAHTESFTGKLGLQLAYLWAAIAKAHKIEVGPHDPVVETLKRQYPKEPVIAKNDSIWDYIDITEDLGDEYECPECYKPRKSMATGSVCEHCGHVEPRKNGARSKISKKSRKKGR